MAEWARLLSECWVKPVAGSNPVLPATKNAFRQRRGTRFCFSMKGSQRLQSLTSIQSLETLDSTFKELPQVQLHPEMTPLKSQPFIKAMRVKARLVRCQLNGMGAALPGAFHCPFHHLAANSLALKSFIYSY